MFYIVKSRFRRGEVFLLVRLMYWSLVADSPGQRGGTPAFGGPPFLPGASTGVSGRRLS